ncbi:MAG TPA: radical SAM/SPASM domain-containing protein [Candidatus Bathyarchaeia archaeon]|nr:radical SAM/SPASM domain-containing protein [Candidatus Bathyarchaeia archaeon]
MKAKLVSQTRHERLVLGKHIPLTTPFVVYIEPSGYCNLKCAFCPQTSGDKAFKRDFMSLELLKKLIDDLSEFPDKIKVLRVCGNGEPLMSKNIVGILQYAKEKKLIERIELISNGTLLNPDLIKNLPRFADRIIFSIEGLSAQEYKRISNVKIDFEKLLKNIRALHAGSGDCIIHVKIHHQAVPSKSKKRKFLDLFGDSCDEIYIEKLVSMWPEFDGPYSSSEFRYGGKVVKRQVCAQMFKGFQIQADGQVVPCCVDWRRINIIGDANKSSLLEIWNGKKLRGLQIAHLMGSKDKIEPCKQCTMNDYCELDNIDQYAEKIIERLKNIKTFPRD